jgi:hypothetical protein
MGSSQGAPVLNHENGKRHGDTVVYNDVDLLGNMGREPNYITKFRVWHDDFIYGIEVFYDGVSSGYRKSNNGKAGHMTEVDLANDESVSVIKGRHGDIVDSIEFHTTKGHVHKFGTSQGGNPFEQRGPEGYVLKAISTGWGGHLHFIGSVWGVPYNPYIAAPVIGKTHGDTVAFDDYTSVLAGRERIRITELRVRHDRNLVFGIEAVYNADGHTIVGGSHHGHFDPNTPHLINQAIPMPEGTHIV